MENKKIVIGCDHAGFNLKQKVIEHLSSRGIDVIDVGTYATESCNYVDFAHAVCEIVTSGKADLGILLCGTGIGMSIAANKHVGIRAAVCENTFSARMTRMHNDANVLCMGERVIGYGLACDIVDLFVDTEFLGGRHQARVDALNALD
ncbi:MAG: ribose 5-phosphate isomerase B [Ruminococcaceae bacterium]|nr:ribose 5-phosphate isomerase B [Oscillospiraceae bacterium]